MLRDDLQLGHDVFLPARGFLLLNRITAKVVIDSENSELGGLDKLPLVLFVDLLFLLALFAIIDDADNDLDYHHNDICQQDNCQKAKVAITDPIADFRIEVVLAET